MKVSRLLASEPASRRFAFSHSSPRRSSAPLAGALALALGLAAASPAWAQGQPAGASQGEPSRAELEKAKALFGEGLKFEREGNWKEALERFRAVGAIKMTANVRFHIALSLENLGELPDALTQFEAALKQANEEVATQVVNAIPSHLDKLRADLGRITIKAAEPTPGLKVEIDGKPVELDTVVGVAPGKHRITAKAPGAEASTVDLEIAKGTERTITVELPKVPEKQDEPPPPAAGGQDEDSGGLEPLQTIGIVSGSVGTLAGIGGVVTYVLRERALDDFRAQCAEPFTVCPASSKPDYDRAKTLNTARIVLSAVGGAAGAIGVGLFILGTVTGDDDDAKEKPRPGENARKGREGKGRVTFAAPGADLFGLGYTRSF